MSVVTIPFKPYFKEPMLSGVKTCTSRTKYLGHPGDTFEAFGATFEILSVQDVELSDVAALWEEEGCASQQDFINVWCEIHPVAGYDPYQRVKLHRFKKVKP